MQPHTSSQRYVRLIMTFTVGLCMLAMSALAQSNTGNIVGSVTLKGGGPLPGVTIWLAGLPPGTELHTTTDVEGSFRFLNLSPGKYSVRAEAQGCSKAFATVDVAAGKNTQVALTLELLAAEEPYARAVRGTSCIPACSSIAFAMRPDSSDRKSISSFARARA